MNTSPKRYCLTLNLKNDPEAILAYEQHHREVWPEVLESIEESGIIKMEIYRLGTRLFMVVETTESFSFEKKTKMDAANPKVQEWEKLMWKYQEPLPGSLPGEKWKLMEKIFSFG